MGTRLRILVIGSGGREHALASRLLSSPSVESVVVSPGNAGADLGSDHRGKTLRRVTGDTLSVARAERPDLVIVGPEGPLCEGLVDRLEAEGLRVFGPSQAAAELEGSKAFMKDFAKRCSIPTARHRVVQSPGELEDGLRSFSDPPVVKADGLCAGKGVTVAETHDQARHAALRMLRGESFGEAGKTVVLEERLAGAEASIHAICDGERFVLLPVAQDHKRLGDGDTGPNTGGMGTYAPAPLVTPAMLESIEARIVAPALQGMAEMGRPFRGALFAGLMLTPDGEPRLLEFNVRFGDPETQVLMNVIEGDLGEALDAAAQGRLDPGTLRSAARHALCVVLAAPGYPGAVVTGARIEGLDAARSAENVVVYHAGTRVEGRDVVTAGGRVLGVTAFDSSLELARERAYRAAGQIHFDGMQYRSDIGLRALNPPDA